MPAPTTLGDALIEEIKDLYNAEKQLTTALPRMSKAATHPGLREAFVSHRAETEGHVARLDKIFALLGVTPKEKPCAGMAGIIDEASVTIVQGAADMVRNASLIASAQRAEHYEIAAYGTVAAWAEALGHDQVATLLKVTLAEEKAASAKLSALAEGGINDAAAANGGHLKGQRTTGAGIGMA